MPTLSYPGVYVQEVPSGVHTITGVATSIAAFFGRATKGPINRAVRILSLSDYVRAFGARHPASDLAESVQHFFENGGTDCYVVRLANGAQKADVILRDITNARNVLVATAKTEGVWGMGLKLEIDYKTANPDETFNLAVIYEEAGAVVATEQFTGLSMQPTSPRFAPDFVTSSSQLIDLALDAGLGDPKSNASVINTFPGITFAGYSQSRRPLTAATVVALRTLLNGIFATPSSGQFAISVNGSQWIDVNLSGLTLTSGTKALLANEIATAINLKLGATVAGLQVACQFDQLGAAALNTDVLRITSNSGDFSAVRVRRAKTNDLALAMMLGLDQGGIEKVRWSNLRPVYTGSAYVGGPNWTDFTDGADGVNALAGLQSGDITGITIDGGVPIPLNLVTTGTPTDRFYADAAAGNDGVREKLKLIADAINNTPTAKVKAELWGYHLALRKVGGTINDTLAIVTSGAGGPPPPTAPAATISRGTIANVRRYTLGNTGTSTFQVVPGQIGLDGSAPLLADYIGSDLLKTGFHALDKVDLFNLMVLPADADVPAATMRLLWSPASVYCEERRAFLLIDAPTAWTSPDGRMVATDADVADVDAQLADLKSFAAIFYPRVLCACGPANALEYMGPTGMIAGLMARTDATRGVWKSPAGIEAGVRGAVDLEVNLTDPENGVLNKLGVNCLRKFPSGIVNWGGRTLDGSDDFGSEWKYVSIRRTALFLEESLYRGTKWIVFENNDEPLWAKIRLNLNAFMMGLFRQGAFQGSTPDTAFFVKCDGETTTQADRNLGIVNIQVGFAPLKPAEFVVITIQQIVGEL